MAELTPQGFKIRTLEEIISEISGNLKATFGASFDTSPESPDGQLIGIFAEQIFNSEIAAQAVYQSSDADSATGVPLEYVCDYNGVYRTLESPTTAVVMFSGVTNTPVPKGTLVSTEGGLEFSTDAISTVGSPTSVTCLTLGAIPVGANQITQIKTPISGVGAVNNTDAGTTGFDRESDAQIRNRRAFSVINSGTNTLEAISSGLIKGGASYVNILNNTSDLTVEGVPPNKYMVVVEGMSDSDIAKVIYENAPAGVPTFGNKTVEVLDSKGNEQTINFSRSTIKQISVEITYKPLFGASNDIVTHVTEYIDRYLDSLEIGEDVIWSDVFGAAVLGTHVNHSNASIKSCGIKVSSDSSFGQQDILVSASERASATSIVVKEV